MKILVVWLLLAIVATVNGIVRELSYGRTLSDLAAHQVSTVTAIIATGLLVWVVNKRWPVKSANQAVQMGSVWLLLTIAFEFGFGHFVVGHSWESLLADYNIANGRIWLLFLLWITVLPVAVYKLAARSP